MRVNSWNEWSKLKTIVVGRANNAAFNPEEPAFKARINSSNSSNELYWPSGLGKKQQVIDAANEQLDHLAQVLKSFKVNVLRPTTNINFTQSIQSPLWKIDGMFCCVCPRDVMITLGNYILEATMSKRSRFFEYLPYRQIVNEFWNIDKNMKWKSAPKPSMGNHMYRTDYWQKFVDFETKSKEQQYQLLHNWQYVLNEEELAFDAADISRFGEDIFVQHSMTTNLKAIEWLKREFRDYIRVHTLHFPHDQEPSHIDCTFIPLRPPRRDKCGIVLTNPERPPIEDEIQIFKENNWQFVDSPKPNAINTQMPTFCQSSKWLSMNILSIDESTLICEQNETDLCDLLRSLDFKVIPLPFRHVFEFGGSFHCATWDIEREGIKENYFSNTFPS